MPTQWLGNLSQLFTALGLKSLATQAANLVAITGGSIDGTGIGQTTPALGSFTTVGAQGYNVSGTAAALRQYTGQTSGSMRWALVLGDNTAESGSNAGSNFGLYAYSDTGVAIGTVLSVTRATMAVTLNGTLTCYDILGLVSLSKFMRALGATNLGTVTAYIQNNYNTTDPQYLEWTYGLYVPINGLVYNMVQTALSYTSAQMTTLYNSAKALSA